MNPIAIYSGSMVIYWSAIIISLGLLSALFMGIALRRSAGESMAAMLLLLPLAVIFSVPICRLIHWYCHAEQYQGLLKALTDYSYGSYVLPGALLGTWLAALIASRIDLERSTARLLDAFAPAAALSVAFIRLSALFNSSCRSKISVKTSLLQHLPIASPITDSSGNLDYRFAVFFVQFLMMLVFTYMLLRFFFNRRSIPMKSGSGDGNTARMFLLLYSASELLMDSTRYDSSYMHFNGFVSIVQMIAAISVLALLVYYSIHSVRANGRHARHWLMWVGYLLTLVGVGVSEYLVQRHGDWYLGCYGAMTVCVFLMALIVYKMYKTCCDE